MRNISKVRRIGVHDKIYHADDVCAIASILELNPDIEVVRTRDSMILKSLDMRIDVGCKNNSATGDYDHHNGIGGRRKNGIPYAAFGLIWRDYGPRVCEAVMGNGEIDRDMCEGVSLDIDNAEIAKRVDEKFVQAVDDYDENWRPSTDENRAIPIFMQDIINAGKPTFFLKYNTDECFARAVERARPVLRDMIYDSAGSLLSKKFLEKSLMEDSESGIVVMNYKKGIPLTFLGENLARLPESFLYCVQSFEDNQAGAFAISSDYPKKEQIRKPFPASWEGLKDGELRKITGVGDADYCFKRQSVFAGSFKGALELARKARDFGE